jgi:NADPH:quinone reductase-like Zn-dependent oxidoreductase
MAALLSIACGVACYFIAKDKGLKNPIVWGAAGLVGSVAILLIASFIKKKVSDKKSAKGRYFDNEDQD